MADHNKQPQLNTRTNYYHPRPNRTARCCCCLFSLIWKFLILIILIVLLAVLVSYVILQPRSVTFHVTHANLTQFSYNNNNDNDENTLRYNLALNFTLRNPNKKLNIYFDSAQAHALYRESRFTETTSLRAPWFSYLLHTKSDVNMSVAFEGESAAALDAGAFERDARGGEFGIDVKVYFEIRFRIGDVIGNNLFGNAAKAMCGIKIPLTNSSNKDDKNGMRVGAFEPTKCEVDF